MRLLLVLGAIITLSSCDSNFTYNNHFLPDGFKLGVATAAFQVEGGWNEDGKGVNVWDWYSHTYPEKIKNNYTADIACDSYHKWQEDVALLKNLGVSHYRMSISWSRILPNGTDNNVNQKGVDYYLNIFKALKDNNIEPMVTLYHWDLPLYLQEKGGWYNPRTSDFFAKYARVCFEKFGEYVKTWITLNEPRSTCFGGYEEGGLAPGYKHTGEGLYQCAYSQLLAHAKAYRVYDEEFRATQKGRVSIVIDSAWAEPASDSEADQQAAATENAFVLGLYGDPIYFGNWPQVVIDNIGNRSQLEGFSRSRLLELSQEDKVLIKGTSDFFCLNTYSTNYFQPGNLVNESIGTPDYNLDKGTKSYVDPSWASDVQWVSLVPWGFRKLLNYVYNHFGKPEIVVTENGWADLTGRVDDINRVTYISQYLSSLLDAYYEDGVNVTGYTVWSLLDNFEWTNGYTQKLGLVQVDFEDANRTRTPKESYFWYQKVIRTRCLVEKCVA